MLKATQRGSPTVVQGQELDQLNILTHVYAYIHTNNNKKIQWLATIDYIHT